MSDTFEPMAINQPGADRISLQELLFVLINRWQILAVVLVLFVSAAVLSATLSPKLYVYSTTVELGTALGEGGMQSGVSPSRLAAMLNVGYLAHSSDFRTRFPVASSLEIKAAHLGDSPLIRIEITAPGDFEALVIPFLDALNAAIMQEVESALKLNSVQELESRLQTIGQELQLQRDGIARDERELARVGSLTDHFSRRLDEAREFIDDAVEARRLAIEKVGESPNALVLLVAGNQLEAAQANFVRIDQRLNDDLPRFRRELQQNIGRAKLAVGQLEGELRKVEGMLSAVRVSRVQIPPGRTQEPVSSGVGKAVLLASLGAIISGLLVIFVLEIIASGRSSKRT